MLNELTKFTSLYRNYSNDNTHRRHFGVDGIDALSIIMSHNILVLQAMAVHYINSIEGGALHQKPNMHLLC